MEIVAEQGFAEFSPDEVTARAEVTRKLLYHHFPSGRADPVLAVAERAGHQLTDEWIVGGPMDVQQRLAANVGRIVEHAMEPSPAWRIYRLARAAPEQEIRESVERFVEVVIESIASNHLSTTSPPLIVRLAIRGYLMFFESMLDDARTTAVPLEAVLAVLNDTLAAAIASASAA